MLLSDDDCPVVRRITGTPGSMFVLIADHAGNAIPASLAGLGISAEDRRRHIAWDIGIAGVTERLSRLLGAPAYMQNYSRLVIDCNRNPLWDSAIPVVSEKTFIPGNSSLSDIERGERYAQIFFPYHTAISIELDKRMAARQSTILVSLHSFTPQYMGADRAMHVSTLYNKNSRCSKRLATLLRDQKGFIVAENEPYRVSDASDFSIPVHAEHRGLDYVAIEIRQDLLMSESGQEEWAVRLAALLPLVANDLS
ncbi:N-formylglutamate amidohydrolase [Acidithiobacillus sp. AMEEHan]|uniref:N-formylglutamate amidohydrolase n=1 Tax=Acidithiobacillus sp. AMEEHan TaxID=2994951 RepID=UPI0027E499CA|nr:N-formylglutamate amidohydrolase [Acidithiobacillus sp. AMEEHan]